YAIRRQIDLPLAKELREGAGVKKNTLAKHLLVGHWDHLGKPLGITFWQAIGDHLLFKCKQTQIPDPVQLSSPNVSKSQSSVPSLLSIEDLANCRSQKKPQVFQLEEDSKDLDKKVPWLVSFSNNEEHQKVWQKGIQTAKDLFKVDGAEYTFLIWFATIEEDKIYEAEMTEECAKKILNTIDNDKFLIRIKFIRPDYDNFKI
ncbi:6688_t:CDS:2, partial [Racocetra persica]